MNIELQIEDLVLDGIPIGEHQLPELQAALENTLGQLLVTGDLGGTTSLPRAADLLDGGQLKWEPHSSPGQMGVALAHTVYNLLGTPSGVRS